MLYIILFTLFEINKLERYNLNAIKTDQTGELSVYKSFFPGRLLPLCQPPGGGHGDQEAGIYKVPLSSLFRGISNWKEGKGISRLL